MYIYIYIYIYISNCLRPTPPPRLDRFPDPGRDPGPGPGSGPDPGYTNVCGIVYITCHVCRVACRPFFIPVIRSTECSPIFQQFLEGCCCGFWVHLCCFGRQFWSFFGHFGLPFGHFGHIFCDFGYPRAPFGGPGCPKAPRWETDPIKGAISPPFGSPFWDVFGKNGEKKHEIGLPFLGPVSIPLFCWLLGRISVVFGMFLRCLLVFVF